MAPTKGLPKSRGLSSKYNSTIARSLIILLLLVACNTFNGRSSRLESLMYRENLLIPTTKDVKVLIYITTHLSAWHKWYLEVCWPKALEKSSLLQHADVAVYLTPVENTSQSEAETVLRDTFKDQNNLTIYARDNPGKHKGAMAALSDAVQEGWWRGYDWVVRVNPDVIIRDDRILLDVMHNDANATALIINCTASGGRKAHTDFFAIKPDALPSDAFLNPGSSNAEDSFTNNIRKDILEKGGAREIAGAKPLGRWGCRAGGGRNWSESDVIHHDPGHEAGQLELMSKMTCPIPF